jgi:phasin family protein
MADETVATKAIETADKVAKAAVEAPVEAKAVKAEAQSEKTAPAATKRAAKAPAAKRTARKAATSKRVKATAPARKPTRTSRKKPARKPAGKSTKPARVAASMIEGVKTTMNKQTRNNVDAGIIAADQLKTVFGDVNQRAKAAVERSAKIVEEFADLTRGNVEAIVASSKVAAKGVESMSQDAAEYSRKSFEEASAALKGFAEVKSATDFFRLQGDFARAAFDNAVAESARMSETMLKLAGDVAQPITSRYTVAAERVKTLAA